MSYLCKAERLTPAQYDENTLIGTPGSRTTIFSDTQCRVWEIQGASVLGVGESDLMMQNLQLSLPWDSQILKKDDEIEITDAPASNSSMLGKRFQIISLAKAGDLRATRRYQVKAVQK